ncbi:MAG TPA: TauD/TfdA family dioxygenase [Rubrivivax sp.]|nr:TauD/TfdA family dioxygenase [Rubrivivax sp.]HRY89152.1 TauD/TfdA family dioxygenase [Rubrivivax sp.]HRZ61400.1 TauD/TfdA family dioxygenase [Rubrivivax sp.]
MGASLPRSAAAGRPFDLDDDAAYRRWRDWKLAHRPAATADLIVELADARALRPAERSALLDRIGRAGFALYRSPVPGDDRELPRRLGAQLGVQRLDANWLADDDGISSIAVRARADSGGGDGFIPYTDRPIRWHTDGYYHPAARTIRTLILHCVRPARAGGVNALLDPELAYLALRDASPAQVHALMQPDAMTIPAREDAAGVARAAQAGPVFRVDAGGRLQLRYTARTRSIAWRDDTATRAAAAALAALLASDSPWIHRVRLDAGMGLVGHNVLHDRSAFVDDPAAPRLLWRARFTDRIATRWDDGWRHG